AALCARRDALPPTRDAATLKRAISRAERDGQLEQRLAKARTERARLEERAGNELAALGLASRPWEEVTAMAVPPLETVERYAEQLASHARDARQVAERKTATAARLDALARDIDALQRGGQVPSERDLAGLREQRDLHWQALRARLVPAARAKGRIGTAARGDVTAYESSVRAADETADRLRREAERVSRLAALGADRDACARELDALAQKDSEIAERTTHDVEAWRALWRPLGVDPPPPPPPPSTHVRAAPPPPAPHP